MRRVTIVYGPPCGGKTTYVEQHSKFGDLVWDYDAIFTAVTVLPAHVRQSAPHPLVMALRDAFVRFLIANKDTRDVWFIESLPTLKERNRRAQQLNAELVAVIPPISECRRRLAERGLECADAIDQWFARHELDPEQRCR